VGGWVRVLFDGHGVWLVVSEEFGCLQTAGASGVYCVRLRRPSAWFRQLSWLNSLLADRDLIVPKSVSSTCFRACG
jgi:hypothetical protein